MNLASARVSLSDLGMGKGDDITFIEFIYKNQRDERTIKIATTSIALLA